MPQKKRILFLSFYFEPDLSAGSFRNTPLAKELAKLGQDLNLEVDVITTLPNRYRSYKTYALESERFDNLNIERIKVPRHKSGFFDQIYSFSAYYKEVKRRTKNRHYDLVFASSSRLFTAYLGSIISKSKDVPLYLDVRDIFLETLEDVLRNPFLTMLLKIPLLYVEKTTFAAATHINLISPGFEKYFSKFKNSQRSYFTHGIDPIFKNEFFDSEGKNEEEIESTSKKVVLYAGNLGEGQGLHKVVPEAAKSFEGEYIFRIIGDGGSRRILEDRIKRIDANNIEVVPPISRDELIKQYQSADYLFIHLNDYQAFEKVLPSKIFELGAIGKPLIAGIEGFPKKFMQENLSDTYFFNSGDSNDLIRVLNEIKHSNNKKPNRHKFFRDFSRPDINTKMSLSILKYLNYDIDYSTKSRLSSSRLDEELLNSNHNLNVHDLTKKKKILYLVNVDWFFISHRLPLAKAAIKYGYDVTVVASGTGKKDIFKEHGINFISMPILEKSTSILSEIAIIFRLIKLFKDINPDIIHSVTIRPVLYSSIATRIAKIPTVIHALSGLGYVYINDTFSNKLLRLISNKLFRWGFAYPNTKLILQNEDDIQLFLSKKLIKKDNIHLIKGSGVNTNYFVPVEKNSKEPVKVALIGRMLWDKGVSEFVSAAKLLLNKNIHATFHLYGAPYDNNPMSISIAQLNEWRSEDHVKVHGHEEDIRGILNTTDIVCLPSYREGLPKSLIEAASSGLPIVTTDVAGCKEIVQDGVNGYLVPPKDFKLLADRLEDLILDPIKRNEFGMKSREIAVKDFTIEKVVNKTMKLYGIIE